MSWTILDMSMIFYRCSATMDFLKNSKDIPTGVEYGTLRIIESLEKKYKLPILCVYDGGAGRRKKKFDLYKANRVSSMHSAMWDRVNKFRPVLDALYHNAKVKGEEADDVMNSVAKDNPGSYIYTNDNDMLLSCQHPGTIVVKSHNNATYEYDSDAVYARYGVEGKNIIYYRAVRGDSSDNIPGCYRIRKDRIGTLINKWGKDVIDHVDDPLGQLYGPEKERLKAFRDNYFRNIDLMTLVELPYTITEPTGDKELVKEWLIENEIYSLKLSKQLLGDIKIEEDEEF